MPQQKRRMKNGKNKHSLQNEIAADLNESNSRPNTHECNHDSDISDDIMKYIQFSIGMKSAEQEIMQSYKEKFNIDPLNINTYKRFTDEEQIERCAQNISFWQKLLREYNEDDFESCTSNPRYFYIKMSESEVRVNIIRRFSTDKDVLEQILSRVLELVNNKA